ASAPADQPAGGVFNLERGTQNESRGVKPVLDSGDSKQCIRRALTGWRAAAVSDSWPVDSGQVSFTTASHLRLLTTSPAPTPMLSWCSRRLLIRPPTRCSP